MTQKYYLGSVKMVGKADFIQICYPEYLRDGVRGIMNKIALTGRDTRMLDGSHIIITFEDVKIPEEVLVT